MGTSVTASGYYLGGFAAPDEGEIAGNSLLDEGVDIIFGVGGKTGNGGLVAVRERAAVGEAVAGIGVDVDQYFTLPTEKGILITSVEKRPDNAVFNAVKGAVDGNFGGGGVYVGTLENDGVGLAPYHDWEDRIPEHLKAEVDPVLFWCGDRDVFCPPEQSLEMYRMVDQAELAIIPNANHFTMAGQFDIAT